MAKNPLSVILKANKLTGPNYGDWLRNLKIVLDFEKMTFILTQNWQEDNLETQCLILASISNELQKSHEHIKYTNKIHMHLEELYSVQTCYERYKTSKKLFRARMVEGSSVHEHDLILQLLPSSFGQFVINFNISKLKVIINELVNMLVTAKSTMKKDKTLLVASTSKAYKGKTRKKKKKISFSKGKQVSKPLGRIKKKANTKEDKYFYCEEI
ncbi:hypothetical protein CDL12_29029 [Handroanthus impetiginosus]|uniref:Uncharacterized protein n=1 Tax=Handroanthus impetiginosus TaxID=429701 RepID=A0A2G9FZL5_9LAMI|nr:hypothetical protein CDL12_29029 [Handroanthus impetiginosus]